MTMEPIATPHRPAPPTPAVDTPDEFTLATARRLCEQAAAPHRFARAQALQSAAQARKVLQSHREQFATAQHNAVANGRALDPSVAALYERDITAAIATLDAAERNAAACEEMVRNALSPAEQASAQITRLRAERHAAERQAIARANEAHGAAAVALADGEAVHAAKARDLADAERANAAEDTARTWEAVKLAREALERATVRAKHLAAESERTAAAVRDAETSLARAQLAHEIDGASFENHLRTIAEDLAAYVRLEAELHATYLRLEAADARRLHATQRARELAPGAGVRAESIATPASDESAMYLARRALYVARRRAGNRPHATPLTPQEGPGETHDQDRAHLRPVILAAAGARE